MAAPSPRTIVNGETVRAIRDARGLTQKEVALASHMSPQYLCDIEAGRREGNSAVAGKLAKVLLVAPAALLTLKPTPTDDAQSPRREPREHVPAVRR
jgi:transcriptional regulator with XRE-family HTH domain